MPAFACTSKISPPRLQRIVYRSRLMEALDREWEKRLVLIVGQAAQGKSTLTASWVNHSGDHFAWLNLGAEDSDPVNLFHLLVRSLQESIGEADLSHLLEYSAIRLGARAEMPLYLDWANAIFHAIQSPEPVRIVLDGLDRLQPDARSFRFLQVLMAEVPENVHLVATSRSMPPFEIERLRMGRQAALIDNDDLAFSAEETKTFFKEICGIALSAELVQGVHRMTEGWVGGLILLSESLQRMTQEQVVRYLSDGFAPYLKAEVFRYLGREIFGSQPREIQELLVRSSILDVVEPGFARDLLGMENPEEVLHELSQRNLFIQRVYDEKRGWLFRYHQLFRDFLRAEFETATNREERRYWFSRAGSLLEKCDDIEGAIRCFIEAKDYREAARLIAKVGMDLLKEGRTWDLSQWLEAIPEEAFEADPWLLLYRCTTRRFTAAFEVNDLERALTSFEQMEDAGGILLCLSLLLEAATVRGRISIPILDLIARSEEVLKALTGKSHHYERTMLWAKIGFVYLAYGIDHRKGLWASRKAYLAAKDLKDLTLQMDALSSALMASSILGEWQLAAEIARNIEKLIGKCPYTEMRTEHVLRKAISDTYRGELKAAESLIRIVENEMEEHGLDSLLGVVLYAKTLLKIHLEEYEEAEQWGAQCLGLSSLGDPNIDGIALHALGLCCYRKGDFDKARALSFRAIDAFPSSSMMGFGFGHNLCRLLVGLVLLQSRQKGDLDRADEELRRALEYFDDAQNYLLLADVHIATALLRWKQGRTDEAAAHLKPGFKVARERGGNFFYAVSRQDIARACILALELEAGEVADYASSLLTTTCADCVQPELARLCGHSNPFVAGRASEIQAAIHRKTVAPLRIETLGGFRVLRGEVPVEGKDWGGNQPRRLLMALICRGCRQVPYELLMEDLWPESSPDAGKRNFRITLHRLRKALEPDQNERFGSSYVRLKNNLLSLDEGMYRLDVDEFLSSMEEGGRKEARGDIKGALRVYGEAEALYRGDFLPEELYSPWVTDKREELQSTYLDLLSKMSQLHEKRGAFKKAVAYGEKLVRTDPTLEAAYRSIMVLHANRGMRTEALRTYEECRKALHRHLDAEPDHLTTALFKQIHDGK